MNDIDTSNRFFVGAKGARTVVIAPLGDMTRDDVMNVCAWLLTTAMVKREDFDRVLEAVENA